MPINIEIKARCRDTDRIRKILHSNKAKFIGLDHQIDTYFNVHDGRLKLREGNIENNLIFYKRTDQNGPKQSDVILYQSSDPVHLKQILSLSLGILTVVDKKREIWFIQNVKFHIDDVACLGSFVEIEAIDYDGTILAEKLKEQCGYYIMLFDIKHDDLISLSYSDLLIKKVEQ